MEFARGLNAGNQNRFFGSHHYHFLKIFHMVKFEAWQKLLLM